MGDTYRVSLDVKGDKDGKLPIVVSIRLATSEERIKPQDEVDHFVSQLKQKKAVKRIDAIDKLQELLMLGSIYATPRWKYIVEQIKPLSEDRDPNVRKQASWALRYLGDIDSIMKVVVPRPKGSTLEAETARELGQWTKKSKSTKAKKKVYDHVKTFLDSDNPELRAFAVNFFSCSDAIPEVKQNLIDAQKDSSPKVRIASIWAMEQVYPEKEIPRHRIPMLNDKSPEVVIVVMQCSVGYGSERELPISAVKKFIKSDNKKIRLAAINAIQFKYSNESEAILLPLTRDKDKDIRVAATYALSGEKSEKAYQRFLELLHDSESLVRIRALQGLELDDYIEAIPHIKKYIKTEKDKDVLRIARQSLDKLQRLAAKKKK